ncbi:Alpha-muurolene synthase [Rhizoctonia solani]|uniref:Terpene synthase n=1 Tax=Rhizoctonia solani TaxID=456999 RepID=A0A0K6GAY7_9AGAM|nr:Alpha-muurolene synthase [Rhizoctonia solani]
MSQTTCSKLLDYSKFPSQVRLPDILGYTRKAFATKYNPHQLQVEPDSYKWFDSYGIIPDHKRQIFLAAGLGLMTSMCYPDTDLENFRITLDFVLWLFTFDDMTDAGALDDVETMKLAINLIMKVLRDPETPAPKFKVAAALRSCFNRMRSNSSLSTIQRTIEAIDFYTQAVLQQKINRADDRVPTIEEYIKLRRDTSAMRIAFVGIEYALRLALPQEVHDDPIVMELALAGNDILTWANDIYSFPIETSRGDTHNFVCVAMWNNDLDLENAIAYVDQMTRNRLQEYIDAKAKLRSFGTDIDEQVLRYIQGIEHCVQGFLEWTFMTPRYFGIDTARVKETLIVDIVAPIALDAPIAVEA